MGKHGAMNTPQEAKRTPEKTPQIRIMMICRKSSRFGTVGTVLTFAAVLPTRLNKIFFKISRVIFVDQPVNSGSDK